MIRAVLGTMVAFALAGCGAGAPRTDPESSPTGAPSVELPEGIETAAPAGGCGELPPGTEDYAGGPSEVLSESGGTVPGQANIYGAGAEAPPAPGGGGGGVLPPVFELPEGSARVVSFPSVTGRVNPIVSGSHGAAGFNDPNGDRGANGSTDVKSLDGISGIVDTTNGMFLVGVFLTDAEPSPPAPPRLDFTASNEREFELAPQIGQVFFIGNGTGRTYVAPDDATRLFFGFADAFLYEGCPGWYGNNAGEVEVSIEVSS